MIKNNAVSRKSLYALIFMEMVNIILFIGGRSINPAFEIMPVMYVLDGWIMLYMHRRAMLVESILKGVEEEHYSHA